MKRLTFLLLTVFLTTNARAGGVLLCDDHGHVCMKPGLCQLIPPVHGCSENELSEFLAQILQPAK